MSRTRRELLELAKWGAAGAVGLSIGYSLLPGPFLGQGYDSHVKILNKQSTGVELSVSISKPNGSTVLSKSPTLGPEKTREWSGVLANEQEYEIEVQTEGKQTSRTFRTCCRGFKVIVWIREEKIDLLTAHED